MAKTEHTPDPEAQQRARERGEKWCHSCRDFHPISAFGPSKDRPDGLNPRCREAQRRVGKMYHAVKRGDAYRVRIEPEVKNAAPPGTTWCNIHAGYCPTDDFGKDPRKDNGLQSSCQRAQQGRSAARRGGYRIVSEYNPAPDGMLWCWWHKAFEPEDQFGRQSTKNRPSGRKTLCFQGQREHHRTFNPLSATKERNRRALKKSNGGSHTLAEILALGDRQDWLCANPACRISIKEKYDADHMTPLSRGGSNNISNIQLLCMSCNRKKHNTPFDVWIASLGLGDVLS